MYQSYWRGTSMACTGEHRYFCAEVIAVEATGRVYVLAMCTLCGETFSKEFKVSGGATPLRMLKSEQKTNNKE